MRHSIVIVGAFGLTAFASYVFVKRRRSTKKRITYEGEGVSIQRGDEAVSRIKSVVKSTYSSKVLPGEFAGIYQISPTDALAFSIGGVGTKTAFLLHHLRREDALRVMGQDIVNHCVNDILVHNARPITFMDYVAAHRVEPKEMEILVESMANACLSARCVLIGGETAEMPLVYPKGCLDLSGAITGMVKLDKFIDGKVGVKVGDLILGLPSSGPHTNGYSLLNRLYKDVNIWTKGELYTLCEPHRCYLEDVIRLECGIVGPIHALAHITGGGWKGNLSRVIPEGLSADFDFYPFHPLYIDIQKRSGMTREEMLETFNCGIGMMVILSEENSACAIHQGWIPLGRIV